MMIPAVQVEAELCQALVRFQKECLGRGPEETRAFVLSDLVLVRCRKVLQPHEKRLLALPDGDRGRDAVKQMRRELIEQQRRSLVAAVEAVLGVGVRSLHHDLSTETDELVLVLTLERPLDPGRGGGRDEKGEKK
jgi:uncharacterized protein YbcI